MMDDMYDPITEMNEAAIDEENEYHRANKEETDDYRNEDAAPLGFYLECDSPSSIVGRICTRIGIRDVTKPLGETGHIATLTIMTSYSAKTEGLLKELVNNIVWNSSAPVVQVEEYNIENGNSWTRYYVVSERPHIRLHFER